MLVHIVSLGGVAFVGSKDIMAVSRVWGHSFAGFRRLQSLRSISTSGTWPHPTIERIVHQSPTSSRHLRFSAQAAALEESPDVHHRRGGRLSRAERYSLVENFILRHRDAHEGKWPSVSAIVKEIGGSRLIVKDIVEELEKNLRFHREAEAHSTRSYAVDDLVKPQERSVEGLAAENVDDEEDDEEEDEDEEENEEEDEDAPVETKPNHSSEDFIAARSDMKLLLDEQTVPTNNSTPSSSGSAKPISREIESDPGLWRRLRNLGQPESQSEAEHEQNSVPVHAEEGLSVSFDSDDTELEEDDEDEPDFAADTYGEGRDAEQREVSQNHTRSSRPRPSLESNPVENYGMFIRFLPLSASEADLRAAYRDCGEILRAQAMVPKGSSLKFTYGFVDFSTPEALSKALKKEKVSIKGSIILTEACSGSRRDTRFSSGRKPVPDHYRKSEIFRNSDARPANGIRSPPTTDRFRRTGPLAGTENGSRSSTTSNGSYLVAVEGLPYPMPISAVEKMLSAHGDISRSELAREDGGTYSAHVEFKTEEARDSALASTRVYLGGRWCRISTGEPILTTVVRLSNIGSASENVILRRCGKIGRVDNIVQRKEGVVDVYYHLSERRNMRKILDRLGDVNADFKRWHANLAPKCSLEEVRNSAEIQDWVEVQKDKLLDNITGTMKLMIIDLEDLRELVDTERKDLSNSEKPSNFDRPSSKPYYRP